MKSIFKIKLYCLKIFFLLVFTFPNSFGYLNAQVIISEEEQEAPFKYDPPLEDMAKELRKGGNEKKKYQKVEPDWTIADKEHDCLVFCFEVNLNLDTDKDKPLIAFIKNADSKKDTIIKINYSEKSVVVKRYNSAFNKKPHYDYRVFDKLFDKNLKGNHTFVMRFYVTSYFMFIVAEEKGSKKYYMTPIYFGLDINDRYPDPGSIMSMFRNEQGERENVSIEIGDPTSNDPFVSNIYIYSLQYSGAKPKTNDDKWPWWWRMQYEFASPDPAENPAKDKNQ